MPDHDPDDGEGDDSDATAFRGWIAPEDRLWRHPSESGALGVPYADPRLRDRSTDQPRATGPWIVGGTAACIVVVLVAAGLVMSTAGTGQVTSDGGVPEVSLIGTPTTDPGLDATTRSADITSMVAAVRPSTVVLRVDGPGGVSSVTGVVAESGGIIVTAESALADATSITAIEPDGSRQPAALIGVDRTSGLAVVRIGDDLPAATFDGADPPVGSVAVATALAPPRSGHTAPRSSAYAGRVLSTGRALNVDAVTTDFSATAVRAPLGRDDLGCPLLDDSGHVAGLLVMTRGTGRWAMAVFLPAELVLGVVVQLVAYGTVEHGWMGVDSGDAAHAAPGRAEVAAAASADGSTVDSVDRDGPAAAAGLAPGDVITAIDGYPVQSAAELRARLYPDPPGMALAVTYRQDGVTQTTTVVLGDQDGDAPGDDPSP